MAALTHQHWITKLPVVGGRLLDRRVKKELMMRLESDALRICSRFGLRYRILEAERANVKRRYGVCFSDGTIRIRLAHVTTGKPLKYSSLVNTLCHELAHLRQFNHSPRFQTLYAKILEWARLEGIYVPTVKGKREPARPQLPAALLRSPANLFPPTAREALIPEPLKKGHGKSGRRSEGPRQLDLFA